MAINLGQLFVKLGVDYSEWETGLTKQAYNVQQFARQTEKEFKSIANSISFVSGTLGLFGTQGLAISQVFLTMGRAASTATKSIASMSGPLGMLAGPLAGIGVGILSAAAGLTALALHTANAAARTQQLAMATGLHASTLAALTPLAKAYGVDQDYLARAIERMEKNALAAAKSGHLMSNGFTDLGINAKQFVQLPIEQKLVILSEKFQHLGSQGHKTAIAIEIFGRAGAAMVPFLEMGPKKLEEWIGLAKRVGAALGDDFYAGALKLKEEGAKMEMVWTGFANTMTSAVLPVMLHLAAAFTDSIRSGAGLTSFAETLGKGLVGVAKIAAYVVFQLQDFYIALQKIRLFAQGMSVSGVGTGFEQGADDSDKGKTARDKQWDAVKRQEADALITRQKVMESLDKAIKFGGEGGGGAKPVADPKFASAMEAIRAEIQKLETAASKARAEGLGLGEAFGPKVWAEATAAAKAFIENLETQLEKMLGYKVKIGPIDTAKIFNAELAEKIQAASKMTLVNAEKEVRAIQEQVAALRAKNEADEQGGRFGRVTVGAPGRVSVIREQVRDLQSAYEEAIRRGDSNAKDQAQENLRRGFVELAQALKLNGELSAQQAKEFVRGEVEKVSALAKTRAEIEDIEAALKNGALKAEERAAVEQGLILKKIDLKAKEFAAQPEIKAFAARQADMQEAFSQEDTLFAKKNEVASKEQTIFQRNLDQTKRQFELDNRRLLNRARESDQTRELTKIWDDAALKVGTFGEKARAVFNELKMEGDRLGEKIAGAFKTAIEGWENSLAHFIVTGQGSLRQVFAQFEETIVKGVIAKGIGKIAGTIAPHLPGPLGKIAEKIGFGKRDGSDAAHALFVTMTSGIPGVGGGSITDILKDIPLIGGKDTPVGRAAGGLGSLFSGGATKAAAEATKVGAGTAGAGASAGVTASLRKQADAASQAGMAGIWASLSWIPIVGPALATGFGGIMLGEMAAAKAIAMLATGGDVTPGRTYLIGERGPELFRSGSGGHVFPNSTIASLNRSGGGGGDTHFTFAPVVQSFDANGVDAVLAEHGAKFVEHMDSHVRKSNWRGQPEG